MNYVSKLNYLEHISHFMIHLYLRFIIKMSIYLISVE